MTQHTDAQGEDEILRISSDIITAALAYEDKDAATEYAMSLISTQREQARQEVLTELEQSMVRAVEDEHELSVALDEFINAKRKKGEK